MDDQKPGSKKLESGAKARQRADAENRSLPFSDALRKYAVPATDVDFVVTDGRDNIRMVLEVTRPDECVYSPENYLQTIDERRRDTSQGNNNDAIISLISRKLGAKSLLVVFEPSVCDTDDSPIWYRAIDQERWYLTTAREFFTRLRRYALGEPEPSPKLPVSRDVSRCHKHGEYEGDGNCPGCELERMGA